MGDQVELLQSISGVGRKTALAILSELSDIRNFKNAKEVTAFAGFTPKRRDSGSSVRGKGSLCKAGSPALRKALFFPAMVAKKHNIILKKFSDALLQKYKKAMLIVSAVMRKLLHIIYGVLKSQKTFIST